MDLVLVFAITLLLSVLVSGLAQRSVLSTAVLFLVAGFAVGKGIFRLILLQADNPMVVLLVELALFSVLFTDGMRVGIHDLVSTWRLPGRALFLGLPLTLLGVAFLARFLANLSWAESFLLGAVLSPTDPVFAAAVVGNEQVPARLRFLLNVESGLNDGLALPIVLVLLNVVEATQVQLVSVLGDIALGIVLGVSLPWVVLRLERNRFFSPTTTYEPLNAFALGLLILAVASLTSANLFLAAFTAGVTVVTVSPQVRNAFNRFGELVTELLKLFALLIFGALISPGALGTQVPVRGYIFAFLVLLVVRPLAIGVALLGSRIGWPERLAAGWFGPKGFASIVYGILILRAAAPEATYLFHLVAIVVAGSIIVSSSTDTLAVGLLRRMEEQIKSSE
jgi:NhaP-type Na+/H+ or K+/H+ antiporter